jgi:hypothetical protein
MVIEEARGGDPLIPMLDTAVWRAITAGRMDAATRRVRAALERDETLKLAWESVPLDAYDDLPADIRSSWVFVLRAGCVTGAERHPNSIQRVMSFRGAADLQTWEDLRWRSNPLSGADSGEGRWLTIPENVWHRPVVAPRFDWIVVSFHTATDAELVEERPLDDEQPDAAAATRELYAGRAAR